MKYAIALVCMQSIAFATVTRLGAGGQIDTGSSHPFSGSDAGIWVKTSDGSLYYHNPSGVDTALGGASTMQQTYDKGSSGPTSIAEDTTRQGVIFDGNGSIDPQDPAVMPAGYNLSNLSQLIFGAVDTSYSDPVGDGFVIYFGVDGAGQIIGNLTASRAQTFTFRGDVDTVFKSNSFNIEGGEFVINGGRGSPGYRGGGVQLLGGLEGSGFSNGDGWIILDTGSDTSGLSNSFGRGDIDIGQHLKTFFLGNLSNASGYHSLVQGGYIHLDYINQLDIRKSGSTTLATFDANGAVTLSTGSTHPITLNAGSGAGGGVILQENGSNRFVTNGSGATDVYCGSSASTNIHGGTLGVDIVVPSTDSSGNPVTIHDGTRISFSTNDSASGMARVAGLYGVRLYDTYDSYYLEANHYSGVRAWAGSTMLFSQYWGGDFNIGPTQTDSGYLFTVEGTSWHKSYIQMTEIAAPGNADSGTDRLYIDSTTHKINFKDSSGTVHVVTSS